VLKIMTRLLLLLLSIQLTGCSLIAPKQIVFNPIEKSDIFMIPAGADIIIPAGTIIHGDKGQVVAQWDVETIIPAEKTGYFLSQLFFDVVLKAKIEKEVK